MTDIMKNGLSRRAFLGLGATAAVAAGAGLAGCSPAASAGDAKAGGDAAGSAAASAGETQYAWEAVPDPITDITSTVDTDILVIGAGLAGCACAAAASDARMSGCELPVVINSGSGNQGITVSVPLIVYARHLGSSDEQLYRALVLSNLVAIHQKTGIGRLSAFCGAVCAGAAAGAGIAYLDGGGYCEACHAVVNALSIVAGMVCDGAKPSCAGKIAFSVNAGILGYVMYRDGQQFYGGDGIVKKGVENTIDSIARLGRDGMRATNDEIIRIMLGA